MDKSKQPRINFDAIILAEENFKREKRLPKDTETKLNFSSGNNINGNKASVEIAFNLELIKDNKKYMELYAKFVGLFSAKEEKNMDLEEFVNLHALALMFPYIREHITNITSKAGIKPILLPPINLAAMLKNQNEEVV